MKNVEIIGIAISKFEQITSFYNVFVCVESSRAVREIGWN